MEGIRNNETNHNETHVSEATAAQTPTYPPPSYEHATRPLNNDGRVAVQNSQEPAVARLASFVSEDSPPNDGSERCDDVVILGGPHQVDELDDHLSYDDHAAHHIVKCAEARISSKVSKEITFREGFYRICYQM